MKRVLSLLLALTFVFLLSACKKENTFSNINTSTTIQTETRSTDANRMQTSETDTTDESSGDTETPSSNTSLQTTNSTENNSNSTPSANINTTHTHSFSAATCTEPKKCSCGETNGSPSGHNWQEATCASPKKCSLCNKTEGLPIEHNYINNICEFCSKEKITFNHSRLPVTISAYYGGDLNITSVDLHFKNEELYAKLNFSVVKENVYAAEINFKLISSKGEQVSSHDILFAGNFFVGESYSLDEQCVLTWCL